MCLAFKAISQAAHFSDSDHVFPRQWSLAKDKYYSGKIESKRKQLSSVLDLFKLEL